MQRDETHKKNMLMPIKLNQSHNFHDHNHRHKVAEKKEEKNISKIIALICCEWYFTTCTTRHVAGVRRAGNKQNATLKWPKANNRKNKIL